MSDNLQKSGTRGGNRRNAGRKKGGKNTKTILKEKIAEELVLRHQITEDIRMLLPMGVRKQGVKALENISKEVIEEEVNKRIGHHAHQLLNAQLSLAIGTQHLYKVHVKYDKKGNPQKTHHLVTDPEEIREYLDNPAKVQGSDYFVITTKQPSETAINAALDRLLGKASTKIVGANNADGSEGPIKVVVANFSPQPQTQSVGAEEVVPRVIESAINDAIEEDSVAHQSQDVAQHPPTTDPDDENDPDNQDEQYQNHGN